MPNRTPENLEILVKEKLTEILSKIGFNVSFIDDNTNLRNPDFIAQKRLNGLDYKIGIELKGNTNINSAIEYGIKTLNDANERLKFDKLLLLLNDNLQLNKPTRNLESFLKNNPTNFEIINVKDLQSWSDNLEKLLSTNNENEVIFYIKKLSFKLIELIAKNPNYIANLEWRDLERTMAELFEGLGFKTTLTPGSKDGGKDVILECTFNNINQTFLVEIKHWRSGQKVGSKAIKEFSKVVIREKSDKGLFLSSYGFSDSYYELLTKKEKKKVNLGGKEKIIELCEIYEKTKNGIYNPLQTLDSVLFANTTVIK
jgi:restriction system protein